MRFFIQGFFVGIAVGVVFLLIGCGPPDCTVDRIYFYAEVKPLDCVLVEQNVALTRSILARRGLATPEQFTAALAGVNVHIHAAERWQAEDGTLVIGTYYPGGDINVNRHMQGFLHEVLHLLDYKNGTWRPEHEEWREVGYVEASIEYHANLVKL